jgi:sigma-B regulation protein RsbU (phosphoserine phosphatase)
MAEIPGWLLVVDDDENNRDMLSRRLQRRGFNVSVAADGFGALESISRESFDLILLDVEMPGMSGFDVLKRVRTEHPPTRLPIIIATARTDRQDVVEALSLGANDYVTKPLDFEVVVARVDTQLSQKRAMDRILSLEEDLRRRNLELEEQNKRMRRSLDSAAAMQQALLPSGPLGVPGVEFACVFTPCDELGGDILNVFPIGNTHVAMYLLDVSGHGVPAALLSVTLSRILNPVAGQPSLVARYGPNGLQARPPGEVVRDLNQRFQMEATQGQYFTLFYGVLDLKLRQLQYVSAGHPPAIVIPAAGESRFANAEGFAVGWFSDAEFEEHTLNLEDGDRLIVYSDGIVDTMGLGTEPFGRERLARSFRETRSAPLEQSLKGMVDALNAFRGTTSLLDDVSALAIETTSGT